MRMKTYLKKWPVVVGLSMVFLFDSATGAQTTPTQPAPQSNDNERPKQDRDRDITRRELASFDRFLDSHHEIAEQVRKNPSLVDNQQFLKDHPALQAYVQQHPAVREELRENPNAFMTAENRYDRNEDANRQDTDRDRDITRRHFSEFLGAHSNIAKDLSKDPSLVNKDSYMREHPELQEYLNAHPEVKQQLMADPKAFLKSTQPNKGPAVKSTPTGAAQTTAQPKP